MNKTTQSAVFNCCAKYRSSTTYVNVTKTSSRIYKS